MISIKIKVGGILESSSLTLGNCNKKQLSKAIREMKKMIRTLEKEKLKWH